jgi:hypothetical protein
MRRISFGIPKRTHPAELENLTIDRQIDRQTDAEEAKEAFVMTNGEEFGKNEL